MPPVRIKCSVSSRQGLGHLHLRPVTRSRQISTDGGATIVSSPATITRSKKLLDACSGVWEWPPCHRCCPHQRSTLRVFYCSAGRKSGREPDRSTSRAAASAAVERQILRGAIVGAGSRGVHWMARPTSGAWLDQGDASSMPSKPERMVADRQNRRVGSSNSSSGSKEA